MSLGIFEDHVDVGDVRHVGAASFDAVTGCYTVTGSGENLWRDRDAFQFLWSRASGDIHLSAEITFPEKGIDRHRKTVLMFRQSLDADSAYVGAALHGDGLTSLQFRYQKGGMTHEVQSAVLAPRRLRLEKHGDYILLYIGDGNDNWQFSGAATRIRFESPFFVGIGVCSHNDDVRETAKFSNVSISGDLPEVSERAALYSTLETQVIGSTDRRVSYVTPSHIEAPNWLPDGENLVFQQRGASLSDTRQRRNTGDDRYRLRDPLQQ